MKRPGRWQNNYHLLVALEMLPCELNWEISGSVLERADNTSRRQSVAAGLGHKPLEPKQDKCVNTAVVSKVNYVLMPFHESKYAWLICVIKEIKRRGNYGRVDLRQAVPSKATSNIFGFCRFPRRLLFMFMIFFLSKKCWRRTLGFRGTVGAPTAGIPKLFSDATATQNECSFAVSHPPPA